MAFDGLELLDGGVRKDETGTGKIGCTEFTQYLAVELSLELLESESIF